MKAFLVTLGVVLVLAAAAAGWAWHSYGPWREWESYAAHFIQPDGRVVDITAGARSTSEGQAYSLFFALVANDRARFEKILLWTQDNLADGDFAKRLPAWLWGQKPDGSWGIIDDNSASDADLWLAYTLIEAGRLWNDARYTETGRLIMGLVKDQEIKPAGAWGALLLPAPRGFELEGGRFKLNPSYYVRFQFEALARVDPQGPWREVGGNFERVLAAAMGKGLAPDWFIVDEQQQVYPDSNNANVGSYDAIRVYLWAALSSASDPGAVRRVGDYARLVDGLGYAPEFVDVQTAEVRGGQPIGFGAAVLPYLDQLGEDRALKKQEKRISEQRVAGLLGQPAHYYDQVLALFGEGAHTRRFRFEADGRVTVRWESLWVGL